MFKKNVLAVYCSFIVGIFIGVIICKNKTDNLKNELKYKTDSLNIANKQLEEDIELLEELCSEKESEISYWGQKYDECKYSE